MELSVLGLRVDAKGAIRALNEFTGSAHNAGRATEKFERSTKNLTAALAGLGGYFGVRQLVEYADTWTLINSRIQLVTRTNEQAMAVQQRLYEIAQRTRNTLAATSVLYTRVALNADQLGRSHEELLTVVESVNAAMLISGATGVEAAQGMRQFAQALGSGRVQGDEFRTMMEAMPVVARAIADKMGVSMGALYKLSADGLINVQTVIDALLEKNDELVQRATEMQFTVGQSFEVLNNSLVRMIGIINTSKGITELFGKGIRALADNMDKVVSAVTGLAAAFLAYRLALISVAVVQSIVTGVQALQGWIELSRYIGRAAAAMRLLQMSAGGVAGILATLAAATVGMLVYKKMLEDITKATEDWINANGDMETPLGPRIDPADQEAIRRRNEMQDMIREAHQLVVLSGTQESQQKRLEVAFEAVNKRVEARRELQGTLLREMLATIDAEEKLKIEALRYAEALEKTEAALKEREEVIERFNKSIQSSFADTFEKVFNDGISKFGDLFDAIKRLFFRLVAEMASANIMQKLGPSFATALGGMFGTSKELSALQQASTAAAAASNAHMVNAMGGEGPIPVILTEIPVNVTRTWASQVAQYLGPVLGGFMIGQMVGGMTSNRALGTGGGALSGAASGAMMGSVIPGVGTLAGAIAGGLAGALGGFLGSSRRQAEEAKLLREQMEANRMALEANNIKLQEMRDAFNGHSNRNLLAAIDILRIVPPPSDRRTAQARNDNAWFNIQSASDKATLIAVAQDLGITLFNSMGEVIPGVLDQLREAISLTVVALTQWGNNLNDMRSRQEAYNKLFNIQGSPQQSLTDSLSILTTLAPTLSGLFGLNNADMSTDAGRAAIVKALQDIFMMVQSGNFTMMPELLGAFADKDQLIDAIVRTKDALDELNKVIFDVVTDFPRAMDIAFYEQLYGNYTSGTIGLGPPTEVLLPPHGGVMNIGTVNITTSGGETGEQVLQKLESAVHSRRARGGSVDLDREGETLF